MQIDNRGVLRMAMIQGQTIDVFAIAKTYNHKKGIAGAQVMVGGRVAGETDGFGRLSYLYTGAKGDLVDVAIKVEKHLPNTYETDFVAQGSMTLVRYFTPAQPPAVKLTALKMRPA